MESAMPSHPVNGDLYFDGVSLYPVLGFDSIANTLMYVEDYRHKHDPAEVKTSGLVAMNVQGQQFLWCAPNPKGWEFSFRFRWFGVTHTWSSKAVSVGKARSNVLFRIGATLCNRSTRQVAEAEKRVAEAHGAGRGYSADMVALVGMKS